MTTPNDKLYAELLALRAASEARDQAAELRAAILRAVKDADVATLLKIKAILDEKSD
jgi:hypothetical protein